MLAPLGEKSFAVTALKVKHCLDKSRYSNEEIARERWICPLVSYLGLSKGL